MSGGGSARIRQRKVSLKQSIKVVYEKDLDDLSNMNFVKDPMSVETGVEKHEEQEFHLQEILAQGAALAQNKKVFIPTPKATTPWPDYKKYYHKQPIESKSYIRQSATVEDCSGCPYSMDEEDEIVLTKMNESLKEHEKCTEDEYEMIIYLFDITIGKKQPFLSTDPTHLLEYKELEAAVLELLAQREKDPHSLERLLSHLTNSVFTPKYTANPHRGEEVSVKKFGPLVYDHYRARKIARKGGTLMPQLKFETNSSKDDHDPYVCFRRRELRQARKTRRTDQQSNERLRRLQAEMRQAKRLFEMVAKREELRLQSLQLDCDVFEQQCKVKAIKRKAKIPGDEEDLLTAFQKRRVEPRRLPTQNKRQASSAEPKPERPEKPEPAPKFEKKVPPKVPSSKIPDLDHVAIEQMLLERDEVVANMVRTKLRARQQADQGWTNKTDDPFVPWVNALDAQGDDNDDLYTSLNSLYPPPTTNIQLPLSHSLGREFASTFANPKVVWGYSNDSEIGVRKVLNDSDIAPSDDINFMRASSVTLRKRVGRNGLKFVDRRGVAGTATDDERWKFDSDETMDTASEIYGDPAKLNGVQRNTQQIRFGSMLLAKSYEYLQEAQQQRQLRLKRKAENQGQGQAPPQPGSIQAKQQASQTPQKQSQPAHSGSATPSTQSQAQSDQKRPSYPISVVSF